MVSHPAGTATRTRNDPAQYDELADAWWDLRGRFAMLHWLARARAAHVPPPPRPGAVLVDIACGGGLLAPHLPAGWRHVGVDLSATAVAVAREHGVEAVRGDALALPLPDEIADVVVAGEVLEHVPDLTRAVAEACRVLAPGGLLVLDTIADTRLAALVAVTLAERLPGGPPRLLHDPALFVDRRALVAQCARHGVALTLQGLRPSALDYVGWLTGRRPEVRMVRAPSTLVLFAGTGTKTLPSVPRES